MTLDDRIVFTLMAALPQRVAEQPEETPVEQALAMLQGLPALYAHVGRVCGAAADLLDSVDALATRSMETAVEDHGVFRMARLEAETTCGGLGALQRRALRFSMVMTSVIAIMSGKGPAVVEEVEQIAVTVPEHLKPIRCAGYDDVREAWEAVGDLASWLATEIKFELLDDAVDVFTTIDLPDGVQMRQEAWQREMKEIGKNANGVLMRVGRLEKLLAPMVRPVHRYAAVASSVPSAGSKPPAR